jgi:hypothetical protein
MPPKKKPKEEIGWQAFRMRGAGMTSLGFVYGVDEADALEKAFDKYDIAPAFQSRIVVRPWD